MKLSSLCASFATIPLKYDVDITGLTLDSRQVQEGYVFLACPGTTLDGHEFIDNAISNGASAVLCEVSQPIFDEAHVTTAHGKIIPIIAIPQLLQKIGLLAAHFYADPSAQMKVIGVTGTNGKTSLTHYLAACLSYLKKPCALIGTVGNGFIENLHSSTHTTPDPITLQRMLADFYAEDASHIAMEVSSHGLSQGRVNAVHFDTAIFTNLSRDHLDYHQTMENYGLAKKKLFQMPALKQAIFNIDDEFGYKLFKEFSENYPCFAYSMQSKNQHITHTALIYAKEIQYTSQGISAYIVTPWGEGAVHLGLYGAFNLSNVLAVITYLGTQHLPINTIFQIVSQLRGVTGRMELLRTAHQPQVIIDYAHTPDALEKALQAIHQHVTEGKIWCVFGCGGDRDSGKRAVMGQIAEQYAEYIIVTNDNPRHENPEVIAQQILSGIQQPHKVLKILDRKAAICFAIEHAAEKDVILIAGKGHENYQQLADQKIPFSDQQTVLATFETVALLNRD